ncbi:MAG: hypothetical protein ACOYJZ_07805 [Acutalibacter sp.]|jgi:hypothetical protein
MTNASLKVLPQGKPEFTVKLLEGDSGLLPEELSCLPQEGGAICADRSYAFRLQHPALEDIQEVRVYVNNVWEPGVYREGLLTFPEGNAVRKLFLDCYGFVTITLLLTLSDGSRQLLTTEHLPVLVRQGQLNQAVKAMVGYVYHRQEELLFNGDPKPQDLGDLKDRGYKSLAAQLHLAREIAQLYESSFGYFKANSRFRIDKVPAVVDLERIPIVTPATLAYVATHPNQLQPAAGRAGVRVGNRVYQPQKALSTQNVPSRDIYENRVVLSFLRQMVDQVDLLRSRCRQLLDRLPGQESYGDEYLYSAYFLFAETRRSLESAVELLDQLYDKFTQLWGSYRQALPIPLDPLAAKPRPTAVFLSVPEYHRIFLMIHQWMNYGIYDLGRESFLLSFAKLSSLYESYLLLRLLDYLKNRGYTLDSVKRCVYPIPSDWLYRNTSWANTFSLSNGDSRLTLYYQPVIFDKDRSYVNGIGLYRNNFLPGGEGDGESFHRGGRYYTPDYLVKASRNGKDRYLVMDAKFSDLRTVRTHHVRNLAFKYLFSLSPTTPQGSVKGMAILYGKCQPSDTAQSAYDNQLPGTAIAPFAELLPLMETLHSPEDQDRMLDNLFQKLLG